MPSENHESRPAWRWNGETLELIHDRTDYAIDVERWRRSAQVLDSIAQVAHKPWLSDAEVGEFVRHTDTLLALQENLCSFGRDRGPISPAKVISRVARENEACERWIAAHWK